MLLDAVIIVLREVLEAAMLASIFLAVSKILGIRFHWFLLSLAVGAIGAYGYAAAMKWVSEWFDFTGQELVNGLIQVGIYITALAVVVLGYLSAGRGDAGYRWVTLMMTMTMILAVIREGSEIMLYLQTFTGDQGRLLRVLTGGVVGAGIGCSVGILVYYLLVLNVGRYSLVGCQAALAVVAAGIVSQVVPLFEQIDILPGAGPVWDTSTLLPETSIVGQLLYAVVGYEATPSPWQVAVYVGAMIVFVFAVWVGRYWERVANEC